MAKKTVEPKQEIEAKKNKPKAKKETIETVLDAQNPIFNNVEPLSRFTDFDISLFKSGKHYRLYEKMGSHVLENQGLIGTYFAVWAPNATFVSVMGNFNGWNRESHALFSRWDGSGIWEGWIPNIGNGEVYKYFILSNTGAQIEKGDPYALRWEQPPLTASIIWDTWYEWKDQDWMKNRQQNNALNAPISVYEVHAGSWRRDPKNPEQKLNYRQLADQLVPYVKELGFTHVEFMPIMEHPYEPSWGYQITGYFAASSRFGTPQDFMYLIEQLHINNIGIILDWVPSHYPNDAHGLFRFDGTALYEHEDPRQGYHPDWKSYIFNYGRYEVRSFLISNALFWLDRFHADGLRVDAVASMLYRDYSRNEGEWVPNIFGGRENLEVISLFKELNEEIYRSFPDVQTIAEESTAFPGVSRPVYTGGLGFGMKWMMGWMNDTLRYFGKDPMYRKWHQNDITFSLVYAFSENFMLPLSHDEVVYGKGSLIERMPGDEWRKFANLRLLFVYMFTHPGSKLLFMGGEFGQFAEWNFEQSLDWHLLEREQNRGMKALVSDVNALYRSQSALYDKQFSPEGFEWIDASDRENCVIVYARKGLDTKETVIVVLNFTPVPRNNYRIGVPAEGNYVELLNSDALKYWGSGIVNGNRNSEKIATHGRENSIEISLPPLGGVVFKVE
jgi:1,4-alpha-glucan branching enzyme